MNDSFRDAISEKQEFIITKENLLTEINDLGAYRILHLHTRQMAEINAALIKLFDEAGWYMINHSPTFGTTKR